MRIIKIGPKSDSENWIKGYDIIEKLRKKFEIGESGNISEFNENLCQMSLISVLEDHIPGQSGYKIEHNDYDSILLRENFGNISLFDLSKYNLFTYLGNSRIDGYPMFSVSYANHRNYILEQLGL